MAEPTTVPCGLCGAPTRMTGTKRCDRCWALERRIESDPALARRVLGQVEAPGEIPSRGEWFLSVKGRQLYPFNMRPEDVDIEEIAHALSMLCRFNGHCREFYSVAQHSVLVSAHLPAQFALAGLLHDATEAYCGDMIRPLKRSMPAYREVEDRIWAVIAERFGLPVALPPEVKEADTRMLQTERRDLLAPHRWRWMEDQIADDTALPYDFKIEPMNPYWAEQYFLGLFNALGGSPHGS